MRACARRRRGSSLIEVAIAVAILGSAALAFAQFITTATVSNRQLSATPVATHLARAAHDWVAIQYRNDAVALLDRFTGSPPQWNPGSGPEHLLAADGQELYNAQQRQAYVGWTEELTLRAMKEDLTGPAATGEVTRVLEITVTVKKNGTPVYRVAKLYCGK